MGFSRGLLRFIVGIFLMWRCVVSDSECGVRPSCLVSLKPFEEEFLGSGDLRDVKVALIVGCEGAGLCVSLCRRYFQVRPWDRVGVCAIGEVFFRGGEVVLSVRLSCEGDGRIVGRWGFEDPGFGVDEFVEVVRGQLELCALSWEVGRGV